MPNNYSTRDFEDKYTYTGSDLGASWTPEKTCFRLWAPTATSARVNLYASGDPGAKDLLRQIRMKRDVCGTWVIEVPGNLNGTYYTFDVTVRRKRVEACDPYARSTGVNGQRSMVIDLRSTDPVGWEKDQDPHAGIPYTDVVIAEAHIRDFTIHESTNAINRGKYLGMIETGTKTPSGIPTGIDHYKKLGITHLHILPMYDFCSVDESRLEEPQFNWGYDPVNFNVPEGSYSSNPTDGFVRVAEFKQMVKGLHDNGISVVMDVVYNHVYEADDFCFNRIVPQYFSRSKDNVYSNGSGCGNDTASERSMVRKYIVDSVKYWADEYHIDGFRFDLVGLIDCETVNAIVEAVHADHPGVIFYGEGWSMSTQMTKENVPLCTQRNAALVPKFAFFSDTIRDMLKGTVFVDDAPGFVSGAQGQEPLLRQCFLGQADWCPSPTQTVNYASCHDNMALFDRIVLSTPEASRADQIRMNNLAAAVYMTAQGIPFFQAGEEMLRSKPLPGGGFDENSYRSPDSVNSIKWGDLSGEEYRQVRDYYRGLIAFRKAHPILRLTDAKTVNETVRPITGLDCGLAAFHLTGQEELFIAFNANPTARELSLPAGNWNLFVNGSRAGTQVLESAVGMIRVEPISAVVLVKGKKPLLGGADRNSVALGVLALGAAAVGSAVAAIVKKRKK